MPDAINIAEAIERIRDWELRSLADYKAGKADAPVMYRSDGRMHKAASGNTPAVFVASDESPDRRGDVISVKGWDLKNFQKNPVYMFAHDYSQAPIGKVPKVWVEGKTLYNNVVWDMGDPFAMSIAGKYERGFMKGQSVGFRALEFKDGKDGGVLFTRQELLEISAVPIPMHPMALQKALLGRRFSIVMPDIDLGLDKGGDNDMLTKVQQKEVADCITGFTENVASVRKQMDGDMKRMHDMATEMEGMLADMKATMEQMSKGGGDASKKATDNDGNDGGELDVVLNALRGFKVNTEEAK